MTTRKLTAWILWVAVAVGGNACLIIDDDVASELAACGRACECAEPLPGQQVGCNAECLDFAPQLSNACLDCLAGLDCPDLPRGACTAECGLAAKLLFPSLENE